MFDWENGIALHAMQGNRASSRVEGEVSCDFFFAFNVYSIFGMYSDTVVKTSKKLLRLE